VSRPQHPESSDPRDIAIFVDSRFDVFKEDLLQHIDQKFEEQRRFLLSAYPANDPVKHFMWHQRRDEQEAGRRDIRQGVRRWGVVGLLSVLTTWNWDAIKEALKALWK